MGSFCSSERSVEIQEEAQPLRTSPKGGEGSFDELSNDDEMPRTEKAKLDWIKACEDGTNPDPWLVETIAEQYDDIDVVETLFKDGDRALHKAVRASNLDLAFSLITVLSAKIDAPSVQSGATPLIIAASNSDIPMIQLLLGKNDDYPLDGISASLHYKNSAGESAADIASQTKNQAMWALLCPDKLADIVLRDHTSGGSSRRDSTEKTPPPPRLPSQIGSPVFPIPPMATDVEEHHPLIASAPPPSTGRRRSVEEAKDDVPAPGRRNSETNVTQGSMLRRSSSLNVINGVPEDEAMISETKGGFINKRKPDWLGTWQRRYLLLKGDVIGWASDVIEIDDPTHPMERKKFNSYEYLNKIDRVEPVDSSSQCKFKLHVQNATKNNAPREYEFKADDTEERDEWVRIIKRSVRRVRKKGKRTPRS